MEISKKSLVTGAKKAGTYISLLALTTSLALALPTTAAAEVRPEDVIAEEHYYGDRSEIKKDEAIAIHQYFYYNDYYGDPHVYPYQIREAMEMSRTLNAYNNYDAYNHSNTRKSEILGLDIDGMYNEYAADWENGFQNFCARNITNKPALDAYINLSCGTLVTDLKTSLQEAVYLSLYNQGINLTNFPSIEFINDKVYAICTINNCVTLIDINTTGLGDLKSTFEALYNRYTACFRSIAGLSYEYPNSFSYNGIDAVTDESAWLSLGDDDIKEVITRGLDLNDEMMNGLQISVDYNQGLFVYDEAELNILRNKGYDENALRNAMRVNATASLTQGLTK